MLSSYFVINYQDQNILSVSLWSLKLRRIRQHQHFRLPSTFWSSECKPSGWRFWLLTIKKIEVGALFPISYFLRQIPKKKQTCQLSYRVTLKVTEGLDWHNSEVTFEEVMQQSSSIYVSFLVPPRKWDLHLKRAWQIFWSSWILLIGLNILQVSCSMGDFGDWESDCYCPGQGNWWAFVDQI